MSEQTEDRLATLSPEKRALLERLVAAREQAATTPDEVVPSGRRDGEFPATAGQRRTFLQVRRHPEQTYWNMRLALRLRGPVDAAAMIRAVQRLQDRHDSLRTTFRQDGDRVLQVVAPRPAPPLPLTDLSDLPADEITRRMTEADRAEENVPFDLTRDQTLRGRLIRGGPQDHALLLTIHHIVLDGWSANVLTRDLFALYDEERGVAGPSPEPALQFHDFADWQQDWLHSWGRIEQSRFWRRALDGAPLSLDLAGPDRPERPAFERGHSAFVIGAQTAAAMGEIARAQGATLFMTLLAAFSVLAGRTAGLQEILVGAPIAARRQRELEDVVGLFANMVPLRLDLSSAPTFRDLVGHVRRTSQDAFCNQDLPIEDLIAELDRDWPAGRAPLIQVIFALYNYPKAFVELDGVEEEALSDSPPSEALQIYAPGDVRPDLCIRVYDQLGRVERKCFVEYNALVLAPERIDKLLADYRALLDRFAADPGAPLAGVRSDG
jgi:hypothetical protein